MVVLGPAWTFHLSNLAEHPGFCTPPNPEEGLLPLIQINLAVLGMLAVPSEYVLT
ncbi:hypothetical protein [Nonomuraea bangladeshensis]|uniref:hypothetical protein n=1 Tax=Nonomuraea bangladeshensis TaxID=404385 RepID=UPI0031E0CC0C